MLQAQASQQFITFWGMDTNDEGEIWIDGVNIADYSSHQCTNFTVEMMGGLFQFYNLVFLI